MWNHTLVWLLPKLTVAAALSDIHRLKYPIIVFDTPMDMKFPLKYYDNDTSTLKYNSFPTQLRLTAELHRIPCFDIRLWVQKGLTLLYRIVCAKRC